jgi:excisionase family DNA binding protein
VGGNRDAVDPFIDLIADRVAQRVAAHLTQSSPAAPEQGAENNTGRIALTKTEAAEALGCSVDHLERHVLPELRIVRSGRLRLIPMAELERWLDRHAARALEAAA